MITRKMTIIITITLIMVIIEIITIIIWDDML